MTLILAVIIESTLFNPLTWTKEFSKTQHQTKHKKQEEKLEKKQIRSLVKQKRKEEKHMKSWFVNKLKIDF